MMNDSGPKTVFMKNSFINLLLQIKHVGEDFLFVPENFKVDFKSEKYFRGIFIKSFIARLNRE